MASISIKNANNLGDQEDWFERGMKSWRHVIQVSEQTLIDNVAATVPWLAPVSPAYMVWHNAVSLLGWPAWVAWVMALAVEGLGLSVVSTAFQLWRERQKTFSIAVLTTVFYLAVVITVNVALELGAPVWIAKALLSLLSVPAAVTIALRTQNAKDVEAAQVAELRSAEAWRLEAEQAERLRVEAERRAYERQVDAEERSRKHELRMLNRKAKDDARAQEKVSGNFPQDQKVSGNFPETFPWGAGTYSDWRKVPADVRERIAKMSTREVMDAFGVSERTAGNWRKQAAEEVHV